MMNKHIERQRGSALIFILIGIALFAAVSYAVTQGMRVTSDSKGMALGAQEKTNIAVTDIMQYLETLKMRVFMMMNQDGVLDTQIDFKNDVYKSVNGNQLTSNINPSCLTDKCHVFSPYNSNGIIPMTFPSATVSVPQAVATLPINGHGGVYQVVVYGVGTSAPDLIFVIHGIRPEICNAYNAKQGITTSFTNTDNTLTFLSENDSTAIPVAFAGAYTTTNIFGANATGFAGKKSFCAPAMNNTNPNSLAIWHVLIAR